MEGNIIDLAGLAEPEWARMNYETGRQAPYPTGKMVNEKRPEVVIIISGSGPHQAELFLPGTIYRQIYGHPDFLKNYREKVIFTHKDFPGDGYFLHVFVRKDVYDEPPPVSPPAPRAVQGARAS
jgi:hypothetical protein